MNTNRNILIAFLLNLFFSFFEFIGGIFTGSVAIMSDAIHDLGDSLSIGVSYFLEKKSKKQPDEVFTYGYVRYSILGGFITTTVLLVASVFVIWRAIGRIANPVEINYNGMIIFAVIGAIVNFVAAYFTREGDSINQKAVNLHMLEDVMGWLLVLVGAFVMKFTDITYIDPALSIGVAVVIIINAVNNLKRILDLFLVKAPSGISLEELQEHILEIEGVKDVHHIHLWSMDGSGIYATMHIVADDDPVRIKAEVKEELKEHGIVHATIETESADEICADRECHIEMKDCDTHHHHHHHH